jgi:hypothetical protein
MTMATISPVLIMQASHGDKNTNRAVLVLPSYTFVEKYLKFFLILILRTHGLILIQVSTNQLYLSLGLKT